MSAHACTEAKHGILIPAAHLLVFHYMKGSHAGNSIASIVFNIIGDAGLQHKVCALPVTIKCSSELVVFGLDWNDYSDNAPNNNTLIMCELEGILKKEGIPFYCHRNCIQ